MKKLSLNTQLKKKGIKLNRDQLEAVKQLNDVSVVTAGAGTGKTSLLVGKINYASMEDPGCSILAITFTKKAVAELQSRIVGNLNCMVNTFHSFFYRILRANGYKSFKFMENNSQKSTIMRKVIEAEQLTDKLTVEMLEEVYGAGTRYFGENKVQELVDKYEVMPKDIHWQMIGHLQRNKVKYIIDKAELIHSVDSIRLAETIDREAEKKGIVANVLLEVNMAREETKFGLMPEEVPDFVRQIAGFQHIKVQGLMTIAPFVSDPEENRKYFANLRKLSVDIGKEKVDNVNMSILSMGMTNDFEIAIEEGATMIRVGTAIFGERNYVQ